jgi:hypothetical protein
VRLAPLPKCRYKKKTTRGDGAVLYGEGRGLIFNRY